MHTKKKTTGLAGHSGYRSCVRPANTTANQAVLQYELLKGVLTQKACCHTEYEAACRRAAEMAGL